MNFLKIACFFVSITLFQGSVYAQEWVSYESQQQINDLLDTGDELLMATDAGLVVMNKTTLEKTVFNKANSNLSNNHIVSIAVKIDNDGDVFIAASDVHKLSNGVWSNLTDNTELNNYLGADLFFTASGDMFLAGDLEEIGRFDGTSWQVYDQFDVDLNGSEIIGFTEDQAGDVYFNTIRNGIFKLVGDTWTQQIDVQTQAFNNETPYFYIDEDNNRWLNSNIYLSVNRNGNIESTTISQHTIEFNSSEKIYRDGNGKMYFIEAFNHNIATLDVDGNWSVFAMPIPSSLFENFKDLLVLDNGNMWLASNKGLYHYDGSEWMFNALGICNSFAVDSQGKIYVQSTDRIYLIEDDVITEYNTDNSEISTLIISGHGVDANDNLWIASFDWNGESMVQKLSPDGTWTNYTQADYPAIKQVRGGFSFDKEGNVWVPDSWGALKFDGTNWTNPIADNASEIVNQDVHSIEVDAAGKIYFSHQFGVTTLFEEEWDNLLNSGIPNEFSSASSTIQFDNEGTLWWGSNRHGVFSYSPASTTSVFSSIKKGAEFSVYPNPANNYSVVDFSIEEGAEVNIFIYNNLGQVQSNLILGQLPAGDFQQRIDVTNFPKGFYTIQLKVKDKVSTKTIIVQ